MKNMEVKKIFVIVGASGAGKDSVAGKTFKELNIPELVSTTTRIPRKHEIDGVDYHFISKEDIVLSDFVEFVSYAGNYYGLTAKEITSKLQNNDNVFCITEIDGLRQLKEVYQDNIVSIFIQLPGKTNKDKIEEMKKRMKSRGDDEISIKKRIANATKNNYAELNNYKYCDYVITNNDAEKTAIQLKKLIKSLH